MTILTVTLKCSKKMYSNIFKTCAIGGMSPLGFLEAKNDEKVNKYCFFLQYSNPVKNNFPIFPPPPNFFLFFIF